jgi:DNA-binding GntR family transcriptional regulator
MTPDPNVREVAERKLRMLLADGSLLPGDALTIATMAKNWRISETPIREAAWRAVGEGWLVTDPRGGFRVWQPSIDALRDAYDFLALLVTDAINTADPARLGAAYDPRAAGSDPTGCLITTIAGAAGNISLEVAIQQQQMLLAPYRRIESGLGYGDAGESADIEATVANGSRAAVRAFIRRHCRRRRALAPIAIGWIEEQRRLRHHAERVYLSADMPARRSR